MTQLLVWSLAVWGLTSILTRGRIFRAARDLQPPGTFFGDLSRCDQCTGLWVGLGLSLWPGLGIAREVLFWSFSLVSLAGAGAGASSDPSGWVLAIVDGLAASAVCAGAGAITDGLKAWTARAAMGRGGVR